MNAPMEAETLEAPEKLEQPKKMRITLFPDIFAREKDENNWSADELYEKLKSAGERAAKKECKLIKLATFGNQAKDGSKSLRHDANLKEIYGVEGDYDAEAVSMAEAQQLLFAHRIDAIVCTTASHTPDKPRWRVFCQLSRPYQPSERSRFVARLNGALGGILGNESFTLSQAYYVGRVKDVPYEVARVRGEFIDTLHALDERAISPAKPGDSKTERLEKIRSDEPVIQRLKERELVLQARADGAVDIKCPFESAHTTPRSPGDCIYYPPHTGGFQSGRFHCLHSHCKERPNAEYLQAIGLHPSEASSWPEPQPLVSKIEAQSYPVDALPATIRAAVEEVQAFTKVPTALVASSALSALSIAIQAHVDVARADKLQGPCSLYLLTVADSGERKSTCDGYFSSALREYEREQTEAAAPEMQRYAADKEAWAAKRDGVKIKIRDLAKSEKPTERHEAALRELEQDKPKPPRVPKLLRGDDTPENLAYEMARGWPSSGVASSEAGVIFGSHAMGKDNIMRNLGLLNLLWENGRLSIGRRTSESFTLQGARFTVSLQVQEATLRSFFDRSQGLARGTGFLARFLLAWPESTQGTRFFTEAPPAWPSLAEFDRRIAALLARPVPMADDGSLTPAVMSLSQDAKAAWVRFHDSIEVELKSGGELYDVRDVASKTADNAARIAALFEVFEHGAGAAVSVASFVSASRIADWHLKEARRFFGELALPQELADASRLDAWLIEHCRRERTHIVPRREIQRCGPNGLREKERLQAALNELAEAGRIREVREGKRKDILVNPALMAAAGAA